MLHSLLYSLYRALFQLKKLPILHLIALFPAAPLELLINTFVRTRTNDPLRRDPFESWKRCCSYRWINRAINKSFVESWYKKRNTLLRGPASMQPWWLEPGVRSRVREVGSINPSAIKEQLIYLRRKWHVNFFQHFPRDCGQQMEPTQAGSHGSRDRQSEPIGGDSGALHMAQGRLAVGVGAAASAEMTLINTMTNSKLSDIIFQIVIALLSADYVDSGGRALWRGKWRWRCRWRWKWKWEMMKGTIGALISPGKVTTCVSWLCCSAFPFHNWNVSWMTDREGQRKAERTRERESGTERKV